MNPFEMYITAPANLAGSVPFGKIGKFAPGIQVQGNKFGEEKVFALMEEIERLNAHSIK